MKTEQLIYNGKIHSVDSDNTTYNWMKVSSGRIVELGKSILNESDILGVSESVDLRGRSVYPGFFDSHVHLVQTALNLLALDLSECRSVDSIKKKIKEYIKKEECNENTFICGYGIDETKLEGRILPNRSDLDECSREYPIWLNRVEYHTSIVNSKTLHMCGIPYTLKGIERGGEGLPTGRFTSEASAWVRNYMRNLMSDDMREKGIKLAVDRFIKKGVTSINCMEGGYMFHNDDAEYVHKYHKKFPIDLYLFFQTLDVRKVLNMGLRRIGGCIFLDGSFGSHTAAISEPYSDKASTNGVLFFDQETINEFVETSHRNNIQVSVHAIGDRAIEQILTAYERAYILYPEIQIRHRIEHFEFPTDNQILRAAKLGLILSVQPEYEYFWGNDNGMYSYRLGKERKKKTNPFRKYIDSGITIVGGSDCDVTPCDPMLGIHAAVNHPNPDFSVSINEAIRMFTANAAEAVNDLKKKGTLEVGKFADFVVLESDLEDVPKDKLKDVQIIATYKEGIELYQKVGDLFE